MKINHYIKIITNKRNIIIKRLSFFLVVISFLNCSIHKNDYTGKYWQYIKFPRHPVYIELKIKKNGKFTILTSHTTITPARKIIGSWRKSNDTIFIFKEKMIEYKHYKTKKRKKKCNEWDDIYKFICQDDTLIIKQDSIFGYIGKFAKVK